MFKEILKKPGQIVGNRYANSSVLIQKRAGVFIYVLLISALLLPVIVAVLTALGTVTPFASGMFLGLSGLIIFLMWLVMRGYYSFSASTLGILVCAIFLLNNTQMSIAKVGTVIRPEFGNTYMYFSIPVVIAAMFCNRLQVVLTGIFIMAYAVVFGFYLGGIAGPSNYKSLIIFTTDTLISEIFITILCYGFLTTFLSIIRVAEERDLETNAQYQKIISMVRTVNEVKTELGELVGNTTVSSHQLSDSAQSQAAGIQEISATIEEIAASAAGSATVALEQGERTRELIEGINRLHTMVEHSGVQMGRAETIRSGLENRVKAANGEITRSFEMMTNAQKGSQQVSKAVSAIQDISDRVNLLSLNAAIEAARAGDSGRGFAVVADEIGKLADQTQQNAKSITNLVKGTVTELNETGVALSRAANSAGEVLSLVSEFAQLISQVEHLNQENLEMNHTIHQSASNVLKGTNDVQDAMREQRQATGEISKTVSSINESTQNLAEKSVDLARAADRVEDLMKKLKQVFDSSV